MELADRPEIEYLDGVAHPKVSPKLTHSFVQRALMAIIDRYAAGRGYALPELRVGQRTKKKTEFVPDIAYYSKERLASLARDEREKPFIAPEIAVEVRSPSDNLSYLVQKIERYLENGALLVLDVNPKTRSIRAYANNGIRAFREDETFKSDAIPWRQFHVAEAFADLF